MKKLGLFLSATFVFFLSIFGTATESFALRKFDNVDCSGSNGGCLDTVIITPY